MIRLLLRTRALLGVLALGPLLGAWSDDVDGVWEPFLTDDDIPVGGTRS